MHWLPKACETSRISSGRATAAVLIATLSAPLRRASRTSSSRRRPPATVIGTKTAAAVRRTTSRMLFRP